MKKLFFGVMVLLAFVACKSVGTMASIEPKMGEMSLPADGEFRIWKDLIHPSFSVTLTNPSATQSCEIYTVKSSGKEKWVSPSLKAGKSLTLTVPSNGHLFFKNFNKNELKITYQVKE